MGEIIRTQEKKKRKKKEANKIEAINKVPTIQNTRCGPHT